MTIALRRSLMKDVYWLNMPKDEFPFLALVEHTNFVDAWHYGGDRILYCGDYLDPSHEYFQLGKEELLEQIHPRSEEGEPRLRARVDPGELAAPGGLRPTDRAGEPLPQHPPTCHARSGSLLGEHEPGVSMGPGHQLRGGARPAGRAGGHDPRRQTVTQEIKLDVWFDYT